MKLLAALSAMLALVSCKSTGKSAPDAQLESKSGRTTVELRRSGDKWHGLESKTCILDGSQMTSDTFDGQTTQGGISSLKLSKITDALNQIEIDTPAEAPEGDYWITLSVGGKLVFVADMKSGTKSKSYLNGLESSDPVDRLVKEMIAACSR